MDKRARSTDDRQPDEPDLREPTPNGGGNRKTPRMFSHSAEPDPQPDTPDELLEAIAVTLRDGAKTNIFRTYLSK